VVLAVGGDNGRVLLWDPDSGTQLGPTLGDGGEWVQALALGAVNDGLLLVAAGDTGGTVRVWDVATSALLATLPTLSIVHSLSLRDGLLAVGSDAGVFVIQVDSSITRNMLVKNPKGPLDT
jgi:WD40 repeat protein